MSKVKMIQVYNQELYVFGKLISRHPEMPWLFSITDVYKACEKPIKGEAKKYGKDPEAVFTAKRPGEWMKRNVTESRIDSAASKLRKRISKYGVDSLSNRDLCIKTLKGRREDKLQGTYVIKELFQGYIDFLQIPELSSEYHKLFPTSSESIVRTIKQHTKSRAELEFSKYLSAAAKVHKCELITQKTELDKYRVDFIFYSKRRQAAWLIEFDEAHHKYQTEEDSVRWSEIRERYSKFTNKPNNGFYFVRVSEGQHEEFLINFLTYLNTGNFNKLNFIHVN
jgi:very-short-patch-repair endonuclease